MQTFEARYPSLISLVVAPCSLVVGSRRFGGTRWLYLQVDVV